MSRAPTLDRRLTLERPEAGDDGAGGAVVSWRPLGRLWAAVSPRSGRERSALGVVDSAVSHRITTRWAPVGAPQRPTPSQRLRDGAKVYDVLAVADDTPHGRFLVIWAREGRA